MAQAWIVRAGRDDEYEQQVLEHGLVAMGWRRLGDLTEQRSHHAISSLVDRGYAEFSARSRLVDSAQLFAFRSRMRPGDHIVLVRSNAPDLAIGTVTGDYAYRPDLAAPHVRPVRWARTDVSRAEVGADLLSAPALTSIYKIGRTDAPRRLAAVAAAVRDRKPVVPAPLAQVEKLPAGAGSAMDNLRTNLDHAYSLATAGKSLQELKVQSFDVTDVYRAAWVQAVASLDHWVRLEIRDRMLAQAGDDPAETVHERWDKSFGRKSFHHLATIKKGLSTVARVDRLWSQVAEILAERTGAEGYTDGAVNDRLDEIVFRRNKIAHEYDADPKNPPLKRAIDLASTTRVITWIGQLAEAIVVVLDDPA